MNWSEALVALLISHAVGDVLFQTRWQARAKVRGVGDQVGRRGLFRHVATYICAFLPALVWIGAETTGLRAVAVGALVAISHLLVDDARLVRAWLRTVMREVDPQRALSIAVDQIFHVLCLLGAALIATA